MITNLTIKNYTLIEDIKVDFNDGLTIITGETGAGKSILLGALSLLMGKRADLSRRDAEKKCVIEAEFLINSYNLEGFFAEEGLDYDKNTIIRREILPSGKSRAFINDSPVNLNVLSALGERLVDIHNQHQTLEVSSEKFQFEIIDALADTQKDIVLFQNHLTNHRSLQKQLRKLQESKFEAQKELDYNSFLLNELTEANLKAGEQETFEEELETLSNVETIRETLSEVIQMLEAESIGAVSVLKEAKIKFNKLKDFSAAFKTLLERLESVVIELDDIHLEISRLGETTEADPQRLMEVETRLQKIFTLQKKHQVATIEELLQIQKELEEKVERTFNLEGEIVQLTHQVESSKNRLVDIGKIIHDKRVAGLPVLISELEALLFQLGLPNARFKIELTQTETFQPNGTDTLQFLFTANKGINYGELKKVASGGELSRIMLAVKSILSNYSKLPTIIFDEIDTGVSGEIANKIAEIMDRMSNKMQVISITHLPQIAAKGKQHFKVFKQDINENTITQLKLLSKEERVEELAQMLGGEKKSASAVAHAKELLN